MASTKIVLDKSDLISMLSGYGIAVGGCLPIVHIELDESIQILKEPRDANSQKADRQKTSEGK